MQDFLQGQLSKACKCLFVHICEWQLNEMKMFCAFVLAIVFALIKIDTVHSSQVSVTSQEMKYMEGGEQFSGNVIFTASARSRMDCTIRSVLIPAITQSVNGITCRHTESYLSNFL